jgi:TATA-binding protein-associated factor Taf7
VEVDEDDVGEKNEKDKRKSENNRKKELARPKHVILAPALHAYVLLKQ